jgi:hypothetical protein
MTPTSPTVRTARRARRGVALALGVVVLLGAFAGTASAKEIGSGGGTTTSTACNPVSSLSYKGDANTSETGIATVKVTYGVKSCTKDAVRASVTMFLSATPSEVVYADPAAPLSGKFTVGVKVATSYQVRVDVHDVATGNLVGTKTIFAAAVRKTGV